MIIYDDILISKNDALIIYVIGYSHMGESIVLLICDETKKTTKFSGVVDCYKTQKNFFTKQLLIDYGVKSLNFLCWTHPDWDHTYGINSLKSFIKKDTAIILPEGITPQGVRALLDAEIAEYHKREYKAISEIINNTHPSMKLSANEEKPLYDFNLISEGKSYEFKIKSFAPISGLIMEHNDSIIKKLYDNIIVDETGKHLYEKWMTSAKVDNNLLSVGLHVSLATPENRITACLCSDLDNKTITKMDERYIKRIFYDNDIIKIPHHASEKASSLLDDTIMEGGIINSFKYGVATSFRPQKLPNERILNCYTKKGGSVSRTDFKKGKIGVVKYKIDLSSFEISQEHLFAAGEHMRKIV